MVIPMFNLILIYNYSFILEDLVTLIVLISILGIFVTYMFNNTFFLINYWVLICFVCLFFTFLNYESSLMDDLFSPKINISYIFFVDRLSLLFSLMSVFIIWLSFYYSTRQLSIVRKTNSMLLLLILVLVLICFCSRSVILFYIAFELLMFPMIWLILVYGSRGRRVFASYTFFGYTLLSSLFMIAGIFILYSTFNTLQFDVILFGNIGIQYLEDRCNFVSPSVFLSIFILFWLAFSIKIPTIPFHVWLPEAHVEASTIGSVILAAILLKLGGFGFLRLVIPMTSVISSEIRVIPILLCTLSIIYASFLAFRHFDIKKIIAYSSIIHMNLSSICFFLDSKIGIIGAISSMLCHSIISAGLFFTSGFLYERLKTRNLLLYTALFNNINMFYLFIFILLLANMSAPFMVSFLSELLVIFGIFVSNTSLFLIILSSLFVSSLFVFSLIYRILYSSNNSINSIFKFYQKGYISISPLGYSSVFCLSTSESFILSSLCFIIIGLLLYPDLFIINILNYTWVL